jgi:serine/threonine-protein kinase
MELLQGMSLADVLEVDEVITEERFVSIFSQVCLGLSYAHGRKVVHRDMKPSNVMLVGKGNVEKVKLVDFGIARVCSRTGELCSRTLAELSLSPENFNQLSYESKEKLQKLTQPGEIFGSPLYMSPEQCLGDEADCVSEVYSLGCMMFEALVGHAPLRGRTAMDTLVKRVNQKAPSINSLDAQQKFTESMELLVAKCLERDRSQRIQTVDAVYDALQSMKMD